MSRRPKSPKGQIGLGAAFVVLGLIALPLGLSDPSDTTRLGIPVLAGAVILCIGGLWFIVSGAMWVRRDNAD